MKLLIKLKKLIYKLNKNKIKEKNEIINKNEDKDINNINNNNDKGQEKPSKLLFLLESLEQDKERKTQMKKKGKKICE